MKSKLIFKPVGNKFLQNKNIPEKAGIYFLFSRQGLIYIGKAGNLRLRIAQHMGTSPLVPPMIDSEEVWRIRVFPLDKDIEKTEDLLIKKYKPKYNLKPYYKVLREENFNYEQALLNYQEVDW